MDRISGLSDELLVKILLFVPTKVAVSTSILSKRWEYLWMWLPKLEYGDRYCSEPGSKKLRCFLDHNLPLHRAPVIESFRLELVSSRFKPECIKMWVAIAVSHCLRELEILYQSKSNILPTNLFTCKSLVILNLVGGILLDVPRMVSLPSLKTLKLQSVRHFKGETLQRLLSNCPVLEDLELELREGDTTRKLTVIVPSLQSLSLCIPSDHDIDGYVIGTPAVKYFKLEDHSEKSHYCLIEDMPNLIEAHLDVSLPDIKSLMRSITSVKRLAICSEVHELNQGMEDWNRPSTVPECMLSSLQSFNWSCYTGEPQEKDIAIYILEHAVHLKTATITSSECDVPKFEMLKELALSSRASTACKLMFE